MPVSTNKKQVQSFIGMSHYLSKFSARLSDNCRAHQGIGKGQGTFQLGPRTSICLYTDEKRDCMCSHTSLLQFKEANCVSNWCKHKRFRCMFTSRRKTSLLCQQSPNRCTVGIHSYWIRITCSCLGYGEISSFLVCKPGFILETDQKPLEAILSKNINQSCS